MSDIAESQVPGYTPLVKSQAIIIAVFTRGVEPNDAIKEPVYTERLNWQPGKDDEPVKKVLFEITLMPEDHHSVEEATENPEPHVFSYFGLIYAISFEFYKAVSPNGGADTKDAIREGTIRARIGAADFAYSCGGSEARDFYINKQREYLGISES